MNAKYLIGLLLLPAAALAQNETPAVDDMPLVNTEETTAPAPKPGAKRSSCASMGPVMSTFEPWGTCTYAYPV